MRVALYTRVSTEEQTHGDSLDNQRDRLEAYVKARGWEVHKVYEDPGYTGRNTRRPGYRELMRDLDKWEALVVLKNNRLHRNTKNFILMMEELHKKEKIFVSVEASVDTSTAMGRHFLRDMASLSELESDLIGERVIEVMEYKAKKEETNLKALGGRRPFGYNWNKGPDKKVIPENPLSVNKEEARVIKKIFKYYDNMDEIGENVSKKFKDYRGGVYSLIANTLNLKKIPSPRGSRWSPQGVKNIIGRRAFYEGREVSWRGHKREASHEAIL